MKHFSLMTSVGADAKSRFEYIEMKGTLEEQVKALQFQRTSFFQPSMILTPQNRYGVTQALTLAIWPKINWALVGGLRRLRGIKVEDLGRAMALNAARAGRGRDVHVGRVPGDPPQRRLIGAVSAGNCPRRAYPSRPR